MNMQYESETTVKSEKCAGVSYRVYRMSFDRRLVLTERIRGLIDRGSFLEAGSGSMSDKAEAAVLRANVDREYLRWGLAGVDGLWIDNEPATVETLLSKGPEELVIEAVNAVRRETGLTGDERKNCASHSILNLDARPGGAARNADGTVWNTNEGVVGSKRDGEERKTDAQYGSADSRTAGESE